MLPTCSTTGWNVGFVLNGEPPKAPAFGRLINNIGQAITIDATYLSSGCLVVLVVAAGYLLIRRRPVGLLWVSVTCLPLAGLLLFATTVNGRYILFHVPFLILLLSIGIATAVADLRSRNGVVLAVAGFVVLWAVSFALPLLAGIITDPASVSLPPIDRLAYVSGDSSGFTLDQVATYLLAYAGHNKRPLDVVGLLANCRGLSHIIAANSQIVVECPSISYTGSEQGNLAALVNNRAKDSSLDLWIVSENSPYISLEGITGSYQKVITFDRPDNLSHVALYHVGK